MKRALDCLLRFLALAAVIYGFFAVSATGAGYVLGHVSDAVGVVVAGLQ